MHAYHDATYRGSKRTIAWLVTVTIGLALAAISGSAGFIFSLLIVFCLIGMPVSIALGLTALIFLLTMKQVPLDFLVFKLFAGMEKFEIMAIPFFILAGNFLVHGGIAKRMIYFVTTLVGHWRGGLALAGVAAYILLAAMSSFAPALVIAVSSVLFPTMIRSGFPRRFGLAVVITSGTVAVLLPPSLLMLGYGIVTNSPVRALFLGGVIPAILLASSLALVTWYRASKNHYPSTSYMPWHTSLRAATSSLFGLFVSVAFTIAPPLVMGIGLAKRMGNLESAMFISFISWLVIAMVIIKYEKVTLGLRDEAAYVWKAYWENFFVLLLIVTILGSIYNRFLTITEAAVVSAVSTFVVVTFVYKNMPFRRVVMVMRESASTSAALLYLIIMAALFSFLITYEGVPQAIAERIGSGNLNTILFLLSVNILLFFVGMVLEPFSVALILVPILFPASLALGIDPIHFGVLIAANLCIATLNSVLRMNMQIDICMARMSAVEKMLVFIPWLMIMLPFILLITYVPQLSIWLPKRLGF